MLISMNGKYYHYCAIDAGTVTSLLSAPSMGQFYNASIKGNFDCRVHQALYSAVPSTNPNVYLPQPASPSDHFGAIAFSTRNGAIGYSYDYSSAIDAQQSAIHRCGDDCTVVLAFANACGALAIGAGRGFGTGWARNRQQAERIALNYCNSSTTGCDIIQWACTTR